MVLQGARVPSTIASYLPRADTISQILRILIAVFEVVSPLHMYIYIYTRCGPERLSTPFNILRLGSRSIRFASLILFIAHNT